MICLDTVGRMAIQQKRSGIRRALSNMAKALSVTALVLTAACSPFSNLQSLPNSEVKAYQLGAGDQIRIITFGEDQLTGDFRVNDTGAINIPLLGSVAANNLTTNQLADKISQELIRRKLFRDPSVAVEVTEYRPIFILGEVSKPGQYPFRPGMTVLSAVASAGWVHLSSG